MAIEETQDPSAFLRFKYQKCKLIFIAKPERRKETSRFVDKFSQFMKTAKKIINDFLQAKTLICCKSKHLEKTDFNKRDH